MSGVEENLREALLRTYFQSRSDGFPHSKLDRKDLEDHLTTRFEECKTIVLPWVANTMDLAGSEILEIGCGTGSSTAAFAERAGYVYGYDIVDHCAAAANERLRIMGISNAQCWAVSSDELLDRVKQSHAGGVDIVLLYAVMEHQSLDERLAMLETVWGLLRPGGHLIVTDSPNRLCYKHYHTSEIPFFDMLPHKLAWTQIGKSPRSGFRESMTSALSRSEAEAREVLTRWGTGISYHEFEAVFGTLDDLIVGDGFDAAIASHKPLVLEEEILLSYFVMSEQSIPAGFARVSIDVIFRKPDGSRQDRFHSDAEAHTERIRRRFASSSRTAVGLAAGQGGENRVPGEDPILLDQQWAYRVAERSLNGRTLLRMALKKLARKITGRSEY